MCEEEVGNNDGLYKVNTVVFILNATGLQTNTLLANLNANLKEVHKKNGILENLKREITSPVSIKSILEVDGGGKDNKAGVKGKVEKTGKGLAAVFSFRSKGNLKSAFLLDAEIPAI